MAHLPWQRWNQLGNLFNEQSFNRIKPTYPTWLQNFFLQGGNNRLSLFQCCLPSHNKFKLVTADVELKSNEFLSHILRPDGQVKNDKMVKKLKKWKSVCVVVELLFGGTLFFSLLYVFWIIVRFEETKHRRGHQEDGGERGETHRDREWDGVHRRKRKGNRIQ